MTSRAQGIYTDITAADYHADPAAQPSLSNSVLQILLARSPLHAKLAHPRLNPNYVPEETSNRRLDLGSIAHARLLGKGRDIVTIDADDYKTKAAREKRDAARAEGKLPALFADYATAQKMNAVAMECIARCPELGAMFHSPVAQSELAAFWQDEECWCRALIDRTDMRTVLDYKTVTTAEPTALARHLYQMDYHIQRAFYLRGLDALDPSGAGRRRFLFLFQEIEPPYACSIMELDGAGATFGARQVERGLYLWQHCMRTGEWPSYPPLVHRAEMPPWMENAILAREISEHEARPHEPMLTDMAGG